MLVIFINQYVNTALLLHITNLDFDFSNGFSGIFKNTEPANFSKNWYLVVGPSLYDTMMTMSVFPYAQFMVLHSRILFNRFLDSKFTMFSKKPKTQFRKFEKHKFIQLYSGPDTLIHIKYSYIMNMIYVCFTYGLALPLLFPITVFGMFNLYIMERIQFAYIYR
jgi:hypothetical protein